MGCSASVGSSTAAHSRATVIPVAPERLDLPPAGKEFDGNFNL